MPEPRLISSYLAVLEAQLPASIVEELADGLAETHRSYLRQGLAPDLAAQPRWRSSASRRSMAGFARVNPARRAARRLLGIGPAVGACWIAALLTSRAWAFPYRPACLARPGARRRHRPARHVRAGHAVPAGGPHGCRRDSSASSRLTPR